MDTPQVLLDHHLKTLRLPTFLREYDKVAHAPPEPTSAAEPAASETSDAQPRKAGWWSRRFGGGE